MTDYPPEEHTPPSDHDSPWKEALDLAAMLGGNRLRGPLEAPLVARGRLRSPACRARRQRGLRSVRIRTLVWPLRRGPTGAPMPRLQSGKKPAPSMSYNCGDGNLNCCALRVTKGTEFSPVPRIGSCAHARTACCGAHFGGYEAVTASPQPDRRSQGFDQARRRGRNVFNWLAAVSYGARLRSATSSVSAKVVRVSR